MQNLEVKFLLYPPNFSYDNIITGMHIKNTKRTKNSFSTHILCRWPLLLFLHTPVRQDRGGGKKDDGGRQRPAGTSFMHRCINKGREDGL